MTITLANQEFASLAAPWLAAGLLLPAEVHTADRLGERAGEADATVLLALALAVRAPRLGHTGLSLRDTLANAKLDWQQQVAERTRQGWTAALQEPRWPEDTTAWQARVCDSPLTGRTTGDQRPLVWHDGLLQIHRMAWCEQQIATQLWARSGWLELDERQTAAVAAALERLLAPDRTHPLQAVAAAVATLARTSMITGGPGTGKTTTIRKMLLAVRALFAGTAPLRVALAAPTGKAAARMREALLDADDPAVDAADRAWLQTLSSTTLHRLLGRTRHNPTRPSFHAGNPMPYDVIVVDEASMIDAVLMQQLLDATPLQARLVLLGDQHQLASVDAGSVLADLTFVPDEAADGFSDSQQARIAALLGPRWPPAQRAARPHPLGGMTVRFTEAFRFKNEALRDCIYAIAATSAAQGQAHQPQLRERALHLLQYPSGPSIQRHPHQDGGHALDSAVLQQLANDYAAVLQAIASAYRSDRASPHAAPHPALQAALLTALQGLDRLRVLTAHRDGPLGVTGLNRVLTAHIQDRLGTAASLRPTPWWPGRVVLVTENDEETGLWNGDVGVVAGSARSDTLRVLFARGAEVRTIGVAALPAHETAFAMTIHKSQGSQFDHAVVVLPERATRLMTRELLYTAVSRAKQRLTLLGPADVLDHALKAQAERATGLQQRLGAHSAATPPAPPSG